MKVSDEDVCAIQFAIKALEAIAQRQRMVGDALEPVNNIKSASALAKQAARRFRPVADRLMGNDIQPPKGRD